MPLYTQPNTPFELSVSDLSVSRAQTLEAIFAQDWGLNPAPSIVRTLERRRAANEDLLKPAERTALRLFPVPFLGNAIADASQLLDRAKLPRKVLSAEEANALGNPFGLQYEDPVTEDAVQIDIERKRIERMRQSVRERAPSGFFFSPLKLATSFASQAFDPINIVSAFLPITSSIKAFQALKLTAGRRFLRGSIEGVSGAAIVEPFVLTAATEEQADYGMYDSLINVGFGGALGGGMHVGLGKLVEIRARRAKRRAAGEKVADAILDDEIDPRAAARNADDVVDDADPTVSDIADAAQPETRADVMALAESQLIQHRNVDIDGTLKLDAGADIAGVKRPSSRIETLTRVEDPRTSDVRAEAEHQNVKGESDEDIVSVSREVAEEAKKDVDAMPDVDDAAEIERLADEAAEDLEAFESGLEEGETELLAALDRGLADARKDPKVIFEELTAKESIEAVESAKRQQTFLKALGECVNRNV